jgi:hypothetical protein
LKAHYMPQYSPDWWEIRRGVPTASKFGDIMGKKMTLLAGAESYIDELIADTVRLDPNAMTERPMSAAMRHGTECEPEARRFYEMERGVTVQLVGFCTTDDGTLGCSPDFLVGDEGVGELKCPQPKTHVSYLRANALPDDYRAQVHGHLIVTGRPWCDFLSYCPGFPPLLVRVAPDEYTAKLRAVLAEFLEKYAAAKEKVLSLC